MTAVPRKTAPHRRIPSYYEFANHTFKQYLTDRGYAKTSFANCMGSIAHFAQWLHRRGVDVQCIDESVLPEFLRLPS